jgi:hypothetical protein
MFRNELSLSLMLIVYLYLFISETSFVNVINTLKKVLLLYNEHKIYIFLIIAGHIMVVFFWDISTS